MFTRGFRQVRLEGEHLQSRAPVKYGTALQEKMQDGPADPVRRRMHVCVALSVRVYGTDPGAEEGDVTPCNHWYSWFYDEDYTRGVGALSSASRPPSRTGTRRQTLIFVRVACGNGARRVRSGGVVGWSRLAGGRWAAASCSTYLSTRSTNVSTVCLTLGGRQLLGESEPNEVLELAHSSASRACRAEGWRGWRRGFLIKHAALASEDRP